MKSLLLKNTLPFYALVRLLDDARIRRPKHVTANYNECLILILLCYSDPIIDMARAKLEPSETVSLNSGWY